MLRGLLAFLLAGLACAAPVAAQTFPELSGRVTDDANIVPPDAEARLTQKLAALEEQSQRQLVVATVPDLQGYDIADYGYRLGREWGIGDDERNDGAILLVAPNERKVRIEVGYGLEPVLTDGMSWLIIDRDIVPRFRDGDMPGGIEAGVDAIVEQLLLPPDEAQRIAAQADEASQEDIPWGLVIFLLLVFFFFVLPIILAVARGGKSRRYGGRRSSPIVWMPGGFSGGSSSSSSWGGFSGGGGSFGGGGASGGW
ncbi:hypothetical protein GCM10011371_24020 [Novosphingobium marinum]|uniref:TPM domain-containing protein n=1 Tax=Novosphingobium marinum TaxID=1514948 RepID=A0A7Z0BWQ4_9SPHN|nr:TPM domain-containing protein [Novosphingobium marinum]NYH96517.1 uncharacterized protein [Novosphingobium marinum]GGC35827.1 hypothetical protein GCM10011371_24020 [Novosphingobium marinum]